MSQPKLQSINVLPRYLLRHSYRALGLSGFQGRSPWLVLCVRSGRLFGRRSAESILKFVGQEFARLDGWQLHEPVANLRADQCQRHVHDSDDLPTRTRIKEIHERKEYGSMHQIEAIGNAAKKAAP